VDPAFKQRVQKVRDQQEQHIEEFGHSLIGVFGTEEHPGPSFTYSIGLNSVGWPELIMVGMNHYFAGTLINDAVAKYRKMEKPPKAGDVVDDIANLPLLFMECGDWVMEEYTTMAANRAQSRGEPPVRVLQMVIPDREGLFPWQQGYDHDYMDPRQPPLNAERAWPKVN
jgi:hypothetical protein